MRTTTNAGPLLGAVLLYAGCATLVGATLALLGGTAIAVAFGVALSLIAAGLYEMELIF